MKANVFITIIETRLDLVISLVIRINPVLRAVTAGTIEPKRPVLYAEKKAADQLIIVKKSAMPSGTKLKIIFERDITITRPNATLERISLVMKTWTLF